MLKLDYKLSNSILDKADKIDLIAATDTDFDYRLFLGDFTLSNENADFSSNVTWLPALHFCTFFLEAVESLQSKSESKYEFTESDSTLHLKRHADNVEITSNDKPCEIVVPYAQLLEETKRVYTKTLFEIKDKYPTLESNDPFMERLGKAKQ